MKYFVCIVLFFPSASFAQSEEEKGRDILSGFYFPFDFGYIIPGSNKVFPGGQLKTGIEFRIKQTNAFFFRFNFDNRSNQYKIPACEITNVSEGKLHFNDYVIGTGYRHGGGKVKVFSLLQGGLTTCSFSVVSDFGNHYAVKDESESSFIMKSILGVEYYIAKNAAITLEAVYSIISEDSDFWEEKLSSFGISIGMTATLF
ncbi:MAG: hypothetical protein K8R79_03650 [Calditrichales bacterium]|nr:hypothetical protein [Calditrichales bacterium]